MRVSPQRTIKKIAKATCVSQSVSQSNATNNKGELVPMSASENDDDDAIKTIIRRQARRRNTNSRKSENAEMKWQSNDLLLATW